MLDQRHHRAGALPVLDAVIDDRRGVARVPARPVRVFVSNPAQA